ncbi:hypothetical protein [Tsuneonella amylolytica]|uniref:hypothetical protein n=1 Tax=Tsuneonella amylolytica TaxID=2338327 RepID=UPI0013C442CB|nr:hypothetical protein [Tsuneonella amylolytica]
MKMGPPLPSRTRTGRPIIRPAQPLPEASRNPCQFVWEPWGIAAVVGVAGIVGLVRGAEFLH